MSKIRLLSFITPSDLMQWSWVYGDYDNWVKSFVKLHFRLRMSCKMRQLKYAGLNLHSGMLQGLKIGGRHPKLFGLLKMQLCKGLIPMLWCTVNIFHLSST